MKKGFLLMIPIILSIVLESCSAQSTLAGKPSSFGDNVQDITAYELEPANEAEEASIIGISEPSLRSGVDKTVKLDAFDPAGKEIISEVGGMPDFAVIYNNAAELSEVAEYIVYGEVLNLSYTDDNASPHICYDFKINRVLRGDFNINDTITVSEYGGYVRGSVYAAVYGNAHFKEPLTDDVVFHKSLYGAPEPAVGEKYVLFITESNLLKGTYSLWGGFMGKYVIDGENIKRHIPPNEPYFYNFIERPDQTMLSGLFSTIEKTPLVAKEAVGNGE